MSRSKFRISVPALMFFVPVCANEIDKEDICHWITYAQVFPARRWLATAYLDIPEGGVLFSPGNSHFFVFSDRLLNILLTTYLVSNNVASN